MSKPAAARPAYSAEEAERRFPGALAAFPGGDIAAYKSVAWSHPSLRSAEVDGILVLPADPGAPGYLYFKGKWKEL